MKYIYGTAADPITKAHLSILKAIAKHMHEGDELYILVSNNDEKQYKTPYDARAAMVAAAVEPFTKFGNVTIMEQKDRMLRHLWTYFKDETYITIVVGEDEWKALLKGLWVHSEDLIRKYNFTVALRGGDTVAIPETEHREITTCKPKNTDGISSSKVRELFYLNPEVKYKEVQDFIILNTFKYIKEHGLYHQNGEKHAEELKEFLKKYAAEKEKNHWGEPSVTTDIVAYNANDILLIRRKKDPYKNFWALPGGFFEKQDLDLNYGAAREFREETTLNYPPDRFEQIKAYGGNFDPRMKICDVAFSVRIHRDDMSKAVGADDAAEARWFRMDELPALAFHHKQIIEDFNKKRNPEMYDGQLP